LDTSFVIISAVGEPALIIALEVFLLEAKAFWGHTCIAGGLFLLPIQKRPSHKSFA
jgi:hypothetical protein